MKKLLLSLLLLPALALGQNVYVQNSPTKAVNAILRDPSGAYVAQGDILQNPFEQRRPRPRYDLDELMQVQSGNVYVQNSPTKAVNIILRDPAGAYVVPGGGGGGAPTTATYITQTANGSLSAEQALGALATGILKSTTTTGVLSIAVAGDFPTLNQSTTGSAATLTTGRTISTTGDVTYTSGSFNGSANVTGTATLANVPVTAAHPVDNTVVPTDTGGWTEFFVTGSDATATTSLVDITGLLTGTLSVSTQYEIEAVLRFSETADANGTKVAIHVGGTGSPTVALDILGNSTSVTAANAASMSAVDTASVAFLAYASANGIVTMKGFITTGTGTPTISIQHQHITAGTSSAKVGSIMRIRKAHL